MATTALPDISARCLHTCICSKIWSDGPICLVTRGRPPFEFFITCLNAGLYIKATSMTSFMTLRVHVRAKMGACKGPYGFT